jgi:hypothetical protein
LLNVDLTDQARPAKRDGFREVESGHSAFSPSTKRGIILSELDVGLNSRLLVAGFSGSKVYTTHAPSGAGWTEARVVEDKTGEIDTPLSITTDRAKCIQGNDLLWLVTPTTGTNIHAMDTEGDWFNLAGDDRSPPSDAVDGVYMLARMWFIAGARLYWSKLLPTKADMLPVPDAFNQSNTGDDNGAGFIEMSPEHSADPVAIISWQQQSLIIFYKNQIEEVFVNSASPLASTRRRLEGRYGCGARDSIVQVGTDIFFLDQFGQYRSLRRNELGANEGVVSLPVSELFRAELPGNLNPDTAYTSQAELLDEFLYLTYPSKGSLTPDRWMVMDLGRNTISGPWSMAKSMSRLLVSDIEGGAHRLYGLDGTITPAASRVYRFFDGLFTDAGTAITFRPSSKAHDLTVSQSDKSLEWYDVEFIGNVGAVGALQVRTSENDAYTTVRTKAVECSGVCDFPLTNAADFPLTDAGDFPLNDDPPKITTMKGCFEETHDGDLPLYDQNLPVTEADLPIDAGGGVNPGRVVQWRILNETDKSYFETVGVRIAARVHNVDLETEP